MTSDKKLENVYQKAYIALRDCLCELEVLDELEEEI